MKKFFVLYILVLSTLTFSSCVGPMFMNLAEKKSPDAPYPFEEYKIETSQPVEHVKYYWRQTPVWEKTWHASDIKEAKRYGHWRSRQTSNEPIIILRKVSGNFGMSTCFWEPSTAYQSSKKPGDDNLGDIVTTMGNKNNDQFQVDCDYFDYVKSVAIKI